MNCLLWCWMMLAAAINKTARENWKMMRALLPRFFLLPPVNFPERTLSGLYEESTKDGYVPENSPVMSAAATRYFNRKG